MNELCCGAPDGFCTRHRMNKGLVLVQLCQGTSPTQCSSLYWDAWERGRSGATVTQESPQLNPPGFCIGQPSGVAPCEGCGSGIKKPGLVTRALTAAEAYARFIADKLQTVAETEQQQRETLCGTCPLNDQGTCLGCGCVLSAKIPQRLASCPAGKWFPTIREPRPLGTPKRNLIYSILPVAKNEQWRWNLDQLATRQAVFNGQRVLAIAVGGSTSQLPTATPEEVIRYSESIGLQWDTIQAFHNSPTLREVVSFPWLLEQVESLDPNEITFAGHAKSVTHTPDSITVKWAERQYRACLDDLPSVERALERFSIAGAFRRFGEFTTPGNHRWHFSGTFYWFRNDDVFSRDWRKIDQAFFGTESWPGLHFKPEQSACLFADEAGDLYRPEEWQRLEREIAIWEESRR